MLYVDVCAAALLAAWAVVRLAAHRPKSLTSALGLVAAALVVAQCTLQFIPRLMTVGGGQYIVQFACVLPIFFSLFATMGWLLYAILDRFDDSNDGERRKPVPSRR